MIRIKIDYFYTTNGNKKIKNINCGPLYHEELGPPVDEFKCSIGGKKAQKLLAILQMFDTADHEKT